MRRFLVKTHQKRGGGGGSSVLVYARVCVTKISGVSQRFKVPITAERGSNGISATRRAQMAPKSSESFCKGHKKKKIQ